MPKASQIQRLMFLFAIAGLAAVTADFACLDDVCAPNETKTAAFRVMDEVMANRIKTLDQGALTPEQRIRLARDGQVFGAVKLDRPIKHPNGAIEMPKGWLPEIPDGHPWRGKLTPSDEAFYSFVEERIIKAKLFDPQNAEHMKMVQAYLDKANSSQPEFVGWTYAGGRTECLKKKRDAAVSDGGPLEPDAL
jgi:hypothetical protein